VKDDDQARQNLCSNRGQNKAFGESCSKSDGELAAAIVLPGVVRRAKYAVNNKNRADRESIMNTVDRRTILASGALALAGAATQSVSAEAQAGPKPIFPIPATTIPIVGETDVFQVRRIYCIGRNYAAHAIERGSDPNREPPFFFQKPTDAIQNVVIGAVADHPYPSLTKNYHHEVELVAALKSGGTNIPAEQALDHVYGYALGLDMTRRDLQNGMAAEKKPWEIGKSFDHAAVLGPIHPVAKTGHFTKGAISLAVNGTVRQNSDLDKMIWSVAEQIAKLSEAFELKAGDIIYSGTPENVGPVVKGDVLLCKLQGLPDMSIRIT
jgi:2-keto-4-pentenoate hydratase/2-oxohepta-3-ene-1,7-dioic acid hydratase in catechol pathway